MISTIAPVNTPSITRINIDYPDLCKHLIGQKVPKPISGTLSGHAAGEPFEKIVNAYLKYKYVGITYKQFEYLNELYTNNPNALTVKERYELIKHASLRHLLSRGRKVTHTWTTQTLFEEKQNDTADSLIVQNGFFEIIDVKTKNSKKKSQAPNIISALKVAEMCKLMIDSNEFDTHNIFVVGLDWELQGSELVCVDAVYKDLLKTNPSTLYINWTAGIQIQKHVNQIDQSFAGTRKEWCELFLRSFVKNANKRMAKMRKKWVKKYETY